MDGKMRVSEEFGEMDLVAIRLLMTIHSRFHSLVELLGVIRRHYMVETSTGENG
jgi:hypothetical protein